VPGSEHNILALGDVPALLFLVQLLRSAWQRRWRRIAMLVASVRMFTASSSLRCTSSGWY
jgi:hypothetical protein